MNSLCKTSHPKFMESSGGYSRTSSFSCYKNGILFLLNKFYFKPFRKYFCLHTSLDSDSVSQLCESFGGFIRKWIREQLNLRKTFPVWWRMKHKGSLASQCSVCGPGSSLSPTYTCRAQCYQASVWLKLSRCLLLLSSDKQSLYLVYLSRSSQHIRARSAVHSQNGPVFDFFASGFKSFSLF